ERAAVPRALDDAVLDEALGERGHAVGAGIVDDEDLAADIEHGERRPAVDPDAARLPVRHLVEAAEAIDAAGRRRGPLGPALRRAIHEASARMKLSVAPAKSRGCSIIAQWPQSGMM